MEVTRRWKMTCMDFVRTIVEDTRERIVTLPLPLLSHTQTYSLYGNTPYGRGESRILLWTYSLSFLGLGFAWSEANFQSLKWNDWGLKFIFLFSLPRGSELMSVETWLPEIWTECLSPGRSKMCFLFRRGNSHGWPKKRRKPEDSEKTVESLIL